MLLTTGWFSIGFVRSSGFIPSMLVTLKKKKNIWLCISTYEKTIEHGGSNIIIVLFISVTLNLQIWVFYEGCQSAATHLVSCVTLMPNEIKLHVSPLKLKNNMKGQVVFTMLVSGQTPQSMENWEAEPYHPVQKEIITGENAIPFCILCTQAYSLLPHLFEEFTARGNNVDEQLFCYCLSSARWTTWTSQAHLLFCIIFLE